MIVSGYDDFSYCREALRLQITDYILKPVNYEEFGTCIDNLKISLFEQRISAAAEPEKQEERAITGITRYLHEHLAKEISLSVLAEQFHLNPQYISQLFKSEIGVNFLHFPLHRRGGGRVGLRGLPGVYQGIQKIRRRYSIPEPAGFPRDRGKRKTMKLCADT